MSGLLQVHASGCMSSTFTGKRGPLTTRGNPAISSPSLSGRCRNRGRVLRVDAKIREIFMPALSSTMTEGKIVSWVKSEGEMLKKGESVVVVESDKADMDVETFYDGFLAAIMVEEGGVAPVGSAIALLADTEEEIQVAKLKASSTTTTSSASSPSSPPTAPAPAPEPVPASVMPSKPSPSLKVETVPKASSGQVHPASEGGKRVVATPYAKVIAKQYNIDLASIGGSGPMGRIVARDVEAAAAAPPLGRAKPAAAAVVSSSTPTSSPKEGVATGTSIVPGTSAPFTTMQGAVSKNMVESLTVPTFRVGYSIVTDNLDALYKKIKSKGVTMTALLAKATALALAKHPVVNASCKDGKSFTYNNNINIAIAVAMDGGLITPVLQDADKVDIYTLSRKWKELVDKARTKQLQPQEYTTGTFTLSNLGMFGVDRFDAILPPGSGAIMAVGASQPTVVATADGLIGVKNQMQVNVTADHRIIYGSDLAAFLQTLSKIIEEPKDLTL
uniref:Dihydrolipoamide acetyltransferase component of pyruvate dehydrogenase complex n=1 Tax=Araucaria cunninghamii TaxID=56994 RepID=A0A0D6R6U0_ARACU